MKRNHDAQYSVSLGATEQTSSRFTRDLKREENNAVRRSGRLTGLLMSGLLVMGLLAVAVLATPTPSQAVGISISVGFGPPALPVYAQPVCPGPGYIWTPGYWAYDPDNGYYWVPGTWVMAPEPGLLWTPGYWGWGGVAFIWHPGYWGPHVGFYGGIDYGFGYNGVGYAGGEWRGREFYYNRAVNNFGRGHFAHVYDRPVRNRFAVNRVSYNGGRGGLSARPNSGQLAAERERHFEATSRQRQHVQAARQDRSQFASHNHGVPGVAATGRAGEFRGSGVVHATRAGGPVNAAQYRGGPSVHPNTGARSPHPGGATTNRAMTSRPNSAPSQGTATRERGMTRSQSHPAPQARQETSREKGQTHAAQPRGQKPPERGSKPSGGKEGAKHEEQPHHH